MPSVIHHRFTVMLLLALPILGLTGCAEIEAQRNQLLAQQREIKTLRDDNAKFREEYYKIKEQLDSQNSQSQKTIEQVNRELETARGTRTQKEKDLENQLRTRSLEYEAYKKESLDQKVLLEAQVAQLQQGLQAVTGERDATALKLKEAEDKARAEQARATDLAQQVAQLKDEVKSVGDQAAALKQTITEDEALIKSEQESRAAAEKQRDEAQQQLSAQAQALKEANTKLAEAQKQSEAATQAEADRQKAAQERDALTQDKEALTKEVAALKGQLEKQKNAPKPAPATAADDPELKRQAEALQQTLKNAKGAAVRLDGRGLRVIIPSALLFDENKATLAERAATVLEPLARALNQMGRRPVQVEGHTDNQPPMEPYADNWTFGFARADRVREFLMNDGGVSAGRLTALSRAQFDPLTANDTPDGRRQNRRVEIVIGAQQ